MRVAVATEESRVNHGQEGRPKNFTSLQCKQKRIITRYRCRGMRCVCSGHTGGKQAKGKSRKMEEEHRCADTHKYTHTHTHRNGKKHTECQWSAGQFGIGFHRRAIPMHTTPSVSSFFGFLFLFPQSRKLPTRTETTNTHTHTHTHTNTHKSTFLLFLCIFFVVFPVPCSLLFDCKTGAG